MSILRSFIKTDDPSAALIWFLYISSLVATAVWLQLSLSLISYVSYALIFVLCRSRHKVVVATIYESHLRNVQLVTSAGFIVLSVVLVTIIGTLGLWAFVSLPIWVVLAGWSSYRVVRGLFLLRQQRSYG